jgi:hypothetical protein
MNAHLPPIVWCAIVVAVLITVAGVAALAGELVSAAVRFIRALRDTEQHWRHTVHVCPACNDEIGPCDCREWCGNPHCTAPPVGDDTLHMLGCELTAEEAARAVDRLIEDLKRGDLL